MRNLQYQIQAGRITSWHKFSQVVKPLKDDIEIAYDLGGISTEEFHKLQLMKIDTMRMYEKKVGIH